MPNSSRKSTKKSDYQSSNKKSLLKVSCSSATKTKLIDFLLKASQVERKLQIIKEMLCEEQDFTPASLFHRIDKARKGHISEKDIQNFLIDNKATFKGSELKILYGKINTYQSDGGVNLRQFQNFILPNQNPKLRYLTMRRPIYIPLQHQRLSQKNQWIATKLFLEIITEKIKLMDHNIALISSFDFNAEEIFNLLGNKTGFVTGDSIRKFFAQNGHEMNIQEIGCLIRIMDKKGEGRIHQSDFKYYMATLGLKKEHQIFDELSPIPALKNFQNVQLAVVKNRDSTLLERYLDNKSYAQQFEKAELERSRKVFGLSRSRKNY